MTDEKDSSEHGPDAAYLARLARIVLTPEETERFQSQLRDIVAYVRMIREADLRGVEPMAHAGRAVAADRGDEPRAGLPREEALANAPAVIQEQFQVPRIVE
jgi:aspartyl-tRNA(Asn)/glutamyl-tRNA(Gln) amidotransferase subunit C